MIPSPNLDDRTFDDIVHEAIRLIPQYCPEWTNHNPQDPGMALIELFAWMTEMTLYRLNRVPDKNYLAFLELMGITLTPPQPAHTIVQFGLHPQAERVVIPARTRVATKPDTDGRSVTFETDREIVATNNALVKCLSQHHDAFADHTPFLLQPAHRRPGVPGVPIWAGVRAMERCLYLSDPRLAALGPGTRVTIRTPALTDTAVPLCQLLEFSYFDGDRWRPLEPTAVQVDRDQVVLAGPATPLQPVTVGDHTGLFLRGQLADVVARPLDAASRQLLLGVELDGEGERPQLAYAVQDHGAQFRLDLDRHVQPLGRQPGTDAMLYLLCPAVLGQADVEVRVDIGLADPTLVPTPVGSPDLQIAWEYWDAKRWRMLEVHDDSRSLTQSGVVTFQRPSNLADVAFAGVTGPWIRARVVRGDFGVPGTFELHNDQFVWHDTRPLRPPTLRHLALRFAAKARPCARVLALNDFHVTDHTAQAADELQTLAPFVPVATDSPTVYFGFRAPFSPDLHALWLDFVPQEGVAGGLRAGAGETSDALDVATAAQVLAWEYCNGDVWAPLAVRDETRGFTQSGFVRWQGPPDHRPTKRYGEDLHWLRVRLEFGGYDVPPLVRAAVLNAVGAHNVQTFGETVLGSSTGLPNQAFRFVRGPVLPGEQIWVRERERPTGPALAALLHEAAGRTCEDVEDGVLVPWTAVTSLFESGPTSRHYLRDAGTDEVRFGDGVRGLVPPKGDRNVVCRRYQLGGGESGNVPAEALTVLLAAVPHVATVRNLVPATGGADLETVAQVKERGPHTLQARSRAVTAADFEWLAREASTAVARVCALPHPLRAGEVTVVIVPRVPDNQAEVLDKPVPSTELLRRVRDHLADKKLLTTLLHVQRPVYRELSVRVDVLVVQATVTERVQREMVQRIRRFLHPLHGGRDGTGWPFGRAVYRVDLYHVIEDIAGVDVVDRVRLVEEATQRDVEHFKLDRAELVHCVRVDVVARVHARLS